MSYSFQSLSPLEFTELVRDLLSERESVFLSVSPEGRDDGIDTIRYGSERQPELVIQCKHYARSSKSSLLRSIKKELPKAKELSPKRYILATSQPLTPENKRTLMQYFEPYISTADDIVDAEDIKSLLRDYQHVEKKHYKLWLHSTAVLEKLLHEGTGVWHSQMQSEIQDKLKIYVQTPSFNEALDILDKFRLVIISGSPGIGKSTLAQMLIAKHLQSEFSFHEIESFDDQPKYIPAQGNVIVYYDDFLGKSVWRDNASPETEKRLEKWLDLIERNERLRLILTTRTYLLESAQRYSDVGSRKLANRKGVELKLSDFSKSTRARILYNHLYFNSVSKQNCKSLSNDGVLYKILTHENFIPRIIESISKSSDWPSNLEPRDYATHILKTLDNPEALYMPAIQERISRTSREILFTLCTWPDENPLIDQIMFEFNQMRHALREKTCSRRDFESSIRELSGSLVEIYQDRYGKERSQFLNPGVSDCAKRALWEDDPYWTAFVFASTSGLQLNALARLNPASTPLPGEPSEATMPEDWYEQWFSILKSENVNITEFLEGLSSSLSLNIWSSKKDWLKELFTTLWRLSNEGVIHDLDWSCLAVGSVRFQVVTALNELDWFPEVITESLKHVFDCLGFDEAHERYSDILSLGDCCMSAWNHLQEKAEGYVKDLLADTHYSDVMDDYVLFTDQWDEAESHIDEYQLEDLRDELQTIQQAERPPSPSSSTVQKLDSEPTDLTDMEIEKMFASLAGISPIQMRNSVTGIPY